MTSDCPSADKEKNLDELAQLVNKIDEDDLVQRQHHVLDRLATIRTGKKKLLEHFKILMAKDSYEEENGMQELIHRMIQSYDGLKNQEEEFIEAMRKIIGDYYKVFDEIGPKLSAMKDKSAERREDGKDEAAAIDELISKIDKIKQFLEEANASFKEDEEHSQLLDGQLKARLEIHFEITTKKNLLKELQKKQRDDPPSQQQQKTSTGQNATAASNSNSERKQRQLERLRREAAKRGILLDNSATDNNNSTAQNTLVKSNKQEGNEGQLEPVTTEEESERIPPIPEPPKPELPANPNKSDELHSKISERFASLEHRKHRMQLIRSKVNNLQRKNMDRTYDEAVKRYDNLSEMRKKLEELQHICTETIGADETGAAGQEVDIDGQPASAAAAEGHSAEEARDSEDNRSSVSTNELLNEVRRAFSAAFSKEKLGPMADGASMDSQTTGNVPGSSFESAFLTLGDRLKVIENVLHSHTDQLIWIGNQEDKVDDQQLEEVRPDEECAEKPAEVEQQNQMKAKLAADRIIAVVTNSLQEHFPDKTMEIDEEFVGRLEVLLANESIDEKISQCFPSILNGVMSPYIGREVWQVEQTLTRELAEALESELAFIFLMQNANALTSSGTED